MIVRTVKTDLIFPSKKTLFGILDDSLHKINESSVVAITSKIVSLCEGRVIPASEQDKKVLIQEYSDLYMLPDESGYADFQFTITNNTLIPNSGIDESNTNGNYLLWPEDAQKTANEIRAYLKNRFSLKEVGVVITDSTCMPMRWGTMGIAIAYSGFSATNNYIGSKDLFGYEYRVSKSSVAGGLAAAATLAMGEGTEQTPIAVIENAKFIEFQDTDPTKEELELFYIQNKDEDLFAPFLNSVKWQKGKNT